MITLISPAKTLDFLSPPPAGIGSRAELEPGIPRYLDRARELAAAVAKLDPAEIGRVFGVGERIAHEVVERYARWSGTEDTPNSPRQDDALPTALPVLQVLRGEAFKALDAASLIPEDLAWAQERLRIFSGLYGILRPLDLIEPYRLDFETPLAGPWGPTVYHLWREWLGTDICREAGSAVPDGGTGEALRGRTASDGPGPVLLNLASAEYARALPSAGRCRVVTVSFKIENGEKLRTVGVYAKQARGLMARWIITNRIDTPEAIPAFDLGGWRYRADLSGADEAVFVRA